MTMESINNGAVILFHMNWSGYVGHATIFSKMPTTACRLVVGLGLHVVSGWLVVGHTYLYYFPLSMSLSLTCQLVL